MGLPHWACGAGGEESGVGSRRPRFPRGRSPAPQDPRFRTNQLRVRLQGQRRGAGPVSAARGPDASLEPRSQPPSAERGGRSCPPSGLATKSGEGPIACRVPAPRPPFEALKATKCFNRQNPRRQALWSDRKSVV